MLIKLRINKKNYKIHMLKRSMLSKNYSEQYSLSEIHLPHGWLDNIFFFGPYHITPTSHLYVLPMAILHFQRMPETKTQRVNRTYRIADECGSLFVYYIYLHCISFILSLFRLCVHFFVGGGTIPVVCWQKSILLCVPIGIISTYTMF